MADSWEWDRNDIFEKFISSSHPNLHCLWKLGIQFLFVGAHTPTCIVCRNWESNFSLLGPLTRIEKSLLQAHFRSVNYCQYN
ncbi:hypothetical protein, partial [Staphylococcus aureus]|uniref:hypothetical protein n=1 Tax=Staphylococcus aureus TaxID=1280 RepID=UPI001F2F32F3